MSYFERLRRPLIVVSPELFRPNEATETQGSGVKPKAPRPGAEGLAPNKARALPARLDGPALLALRQAQGSQAKGSPAPGRGAIRSASRPTPSGPPDPGRHQRKCRVCCHPDRDAIEEAFIHWHSPTLIAQDYEISDDSIYRHAYATGLDAVRSRNLRCALERILEEAERVTPTADSIVRAARAYTRINHAGEWVEPPTHVIVSSGSAFHLGESRAATDRSSPCTERSERVVTHRLSRPSNRGIRELENGSTR